MDKWFDEMRRAMEAAYIGREAPWQESGFSGPEERWTALRKPVADCIERPGAFLDIGCANGFLLECVARRTAERGIAVELHGLDLSEALVRRARVRLPAHSDRLWVGNALTWTPPRRFDFVRTELVYVPAERERDYVRRLIADYLVEGGLLLVANYLEGSSNPERHIVAGAHPTTDIRSRLGELGFEVAFIRDGLDAVKGRRTRVAVVAA
jgi:SAM-dependent methyltransferase